MNKEIEYRCRNPKCRKIFKESQIKSQRQKQIQKADYTHSITCPYCSRDHILPLTEVDWVSKVIIK